MNKYIVISICFGFILKSSNAFPQDGLKIGHVNVVEILTVLPETDSAQILIEQDTKDLELMLEEMQVEYNKLLNDYQKNINTYSELIRTTKESDLIEMQNRIQAFQQNASQQLQQRNSELMQPIYARIQLAIDKVASNDNFTYVLDISQGAVVFTGDQSQNINSMVLLELGISGDN